MEYRPFDSVESALKHLFPGDRLESRRSGGGGGCINETSRLVLESGRILFIKENATAPDDMFPEEARGLEALIRAFPLKVPRPLAWGRAGRRSFLILENVENAPKKEDFWESFGRALAEMHGRKDSSLFGFDSDNYIGSTRQVNGTMESWTAFFGEKRLLFQAELAVKKGQASSSLVGQIESICRKLPEILPEPDHPSLLHGDLWSGNFMVGEDGSAVLIDPAVYYGHREADLAMTGLFGGFSPVFYRSYEEVNPLVPGYPARKDLYNLYHMLNHLNLFGSSYAGSVRSIISAYL